MPNSDRVATEAFTSATHWDDQWVTRPRPTLPSLLRVDTRNRARLLKRVVKPGMTFLEIGCAPGKMLAHAAGVLGASVAGVDYSPLGIQWCREVFAGVGLKADLRCEDVFNTTFEPASFDVVHSMGVIEHFADPTRIVRVHAELLKPGGIAIVAIPNLTGLYATLARYFSPDLLALHNLSIMNCHALGSLAPADLVDGVEVFPFGQMCLDAVNIGRRWHPFAARPLYYLTEMLSAAQVVHIPALCPYLVLQFRRSGQTNSQ